MAGFFTARMRRYLPITLLVVLASTAIVITRFRGPQSAPITAQVGGPNPIITPWDRIPDFCATATKTARNGNWNNAANWTPSGVPTSSDIVQIPAGVTMTYDAVNGGADCIGVHGTLSVTRSTNTSFKVGTLLVYSDGTLDWGTVSSPVPANVTAEMVFVDKPINTTIDPSQYGTGLISLGEVTMHGAEKNPTFVRMAVEPRAGHTTLQLEEPVSGWRIGDRIVVPESHQQDGREDFPTPLTEERIIQNISSDGLTITLNTPLSNTHPGARNLDTNQIEFLPHVGNLTRNIIVRSASLAESGKAAYCTLGDKLTGTSGCATRGHTLYTINAAVDIRFASFSQLGRTTFDVLDATTFNSNGTVARLGPNQLGRYPIHMHHLAGTGSPRYSLIGNAVEGGAYDNTYKWGIAIHDSDSGLIRQNVVYNFSGAGYAFEEGTEDFNVFEQNFGLRVRGSGGRADAFEPGREGDIVWAQGNNNYFRDNVTANAAAHGFTFFRGGPFLEFARNEYYAGRNGLTMWHINGAGTARPGEQPDAPQSTIKDFHVWHTHHHGAGLMYPSLNVTFDGLVVRMDPTKSWAMGFYFGDYTTRNIIIRNADIQGASVGIDVPLKANAETRKTEEGTILIENSTLRNYKNIQVGTIMGPGDGAGMAPRRTIIRNVRFNTLVGVSGQRDNNNVLVPQMPIDMDYQDRVGLNNVQYTMPDRTFVCDYNGQAGNNFQAYYLEQRANFGPVPVTGGPFDTVGCPEAGLTNQQCWDRYGKAIAGEIALCTDSTTRPEIRGYTCVTAAATAVCNGLPPPPPPVPSSRSSSSALSSSRSSSVPSSSRSSSAVSSSVLSSSRSSSVSSSSVAAPPASSSISSSIPASSSVSSIPPDTTPPVISQIQVTNITTNSVTITWTTNENSNSQVDVGTSTAYGSQSPLDATLLTNHTIVLAGLTQGTLYHFRVRSRDAAGNLSFSSDQTFTTDIPPPRDFTACISTLEGTERNYDFVAVTITPNGTTTPLLSTTAATNSIGKLFLNDPAFLNVSAGALYTITLKPRGYLAQTKTNVNLATLLGSTCLTFQTPFKFGDLNNNGTIELADFQRLLQYRRNLANDASLGWILGGKRQVPLRLAVFLIRNMRQQAGG
jgi:hypothetical protein